MIQPKNKRQYVTKMVFLPDMVLEVKNTRI